ncbi:MAG: helix-turn-helix transcriptional regulator [Ferrovibrio sp.]|nr:helix-turn-helix transcriptional regulator [Ferrovibrio sp.]
MPRVEKPYLVLGANLLAARKARGWTQQELANRIGWERSSIANIEAGRQRVLIHSVKQIAKALRISTMRIMKGVL